ncbi:MAG: hypothetical protein K5905_17510 [Roseibium sp.]|uniref:hypothetical protein n=1 Tax=Roseibium sp. TaxID=1936156 RepID=UPI002636DB75|nr:hypothetical protein [Roseibium sp.]MCV0427261.1 hypothetical protein [Roseibium sp.]
MVEFEVVVSAVAGAGFLQVSRDRALLLPLNHASLRGGIAESRASVPRRVFILYTVVYKICDDPKYEIEASAKRDRHGFLTESPYVSMLATRAKVLYSGGQSVQLGVNFGSALRISIATMPEKGALVPDVEPPEICDRQPARRVSTRLPRTFKEIARRDPVP